MKIVLSTTSKKIIKRSLDENPEERFFGTESFGWVTAEEEEDNYCNNYGYIYPKGDGYGNMAIYYTREELESYL